MRQGGSARARTETVEDTQAKAPPPTLPQDINIDVLEDTLSFYIRTVNLASRAISTSVWKAGTSPRARARSRPFFWWTIIRASAPPSSRISSSRTARPWSAPRPDGGPWPDTPRDLAGGKPRPAALHHRGRGGAGVKIREIVPQQSRDFFSFIPEDEQKLVTDILKRAYRASWASHERSPKSRRAHIGRQPRIGDHIAAEHLRQGCASRWGCAAPCPAGWAFRP